MSPPCVATIFEGDNGGATSRGVTATDITIAVPGDESLRDGPYRQIDALFDHFNNHFELYGRRLQPVFVPGSMGTVTDQRAFAATVAAAGAFASLDARADTVSPMTSFHHELARQRVITVVGRELPQSDVALFDEVHPYAWSVLPSIESVWRATADLICTRLAGKPASHAGPDLSKATRKFGVVVEESTFAPLNLFPQRLFKAMDDCGAAPVVVTTTSVPSDRNAGQALKDAGVTTLLCACNQTFALGNLANAVGDWFPELLLPEIGYPSEWIEKYINQPSLAAHAPRMFAIRPTPKLQPFQVRPFFGAMVEATGGSFKPSGVDSNRDFFTLEMLYRQLLLLASGIQTAGPNLTPDTFGQGLMATQFPNPGCGQPPLGVPCVGFGPGDHSLYDDFAVTWWNPTIASDSVVVAGAGNRLGGWCYLGAGARYRPGQLPADTDTRLFNPAEPCR